MTAYLMTMMALNALGVVAYLRTKPGAPRSPEPPAGVLMFGLLVHAALFGWGLWLLAGGAA